MKPINAKPKILYVDDEEENLLVFKSSFRRSYDVITALSGKKALEILSNQEVDVVISDQRMPHLNGVELLNSLPDEPESVRMILTGYTDIETVITALNEGKIHKYISKPWDKAALKKVIDSELAALEIRRSTKFNGTGNQSGIKPPDQGARSDKGSSILVSGNSETVTQLQKELKESYNYLLLLSEIGQEIIENKSIKAIIEKTYGEVNTLLDATIFACGIYNPEKKILEYTVMEDGNWLGGENDVQDIGKPGPWTFHNKKEIYSNDWLNECELILGKPPTVVIGDFSRSLIYLPLLQGDDAIGVLTVQSFKPNAYSNYQLNIMKNMAIYVSTALVNAKSYHQIELQKQEIEAKNSDLERKVAERTKELQLTNDEVQLQRDQLEGMYSKVKLLGEIGQQITSTLSLDAIVERVYESVNNLMDASIFAIGVLNEGKQRIEFRGAIEKGEQLPNYFIGLDEADRLPTWCFNHQKEIIINNYNVEYNKYVKLASKPKAGESSESVLYLPLLAGEIKIGVITVQSFKTHSYSHYHLDILRSLGSYISIAIQNAKSYQKMTEAFEQLKSTQAKLVESEKMASLGVLTAGVAHEINNPVNFISGGIISLKENYQEIEELLKKFLKFQPEMDKQQAEKLWAEIEEYVHEIDIDSLLPEIQDLFKSISNGAKRSMEIVKGLKNFSRLDEQDMKEVDLEEGLDSTLVILNNQLKNNIVVEKKYTGIPKVLCFPGQINQVFMNILSNAIQSIQDDGIIKIETITKASNVEIRIKDSGQGMSPEIKQHIFEPFYTTKSVGEGTGLGLSISYGIINEHKGNIEVESEVGNGSTFIISIPLKP